MRLPKALQICHCGVGLSGTLNFKMSISLKFKKDLSTLKAAAEGEIFLDVKNPKLFKKVKKYYEKEGVVFSDDALDNYDILIDQLYSDLQPETVES